MNERNQGHIARGRGAGYNPQNRFERLSYKAREAPSERVETVLYRDSSKSVLSKNSSPDVPFTYSINPYRGCEHGCVYCYARPTHEYLGFSSGLDFETKIMVKEDAPERLRAELTKAKWEPSVIALSGNTDAYQPIERGLELTRRCLEVLVEFRNPVQVITKNALVTRDIDLLSELAEHQAAGVALSITTLNSTLVSQLEPRTSSPQRRLEALRTLSEAGIRTSVLIAPVIPGLNDHEIPAICNEVAKAGATAVGFVMLRLPLSVAPLFEDWLTRHYPDRKAKVLHKLQEMRAGKLNDPNFGSRMRGTGPVAQQIADLLRLARRRTGLNKRHEPLSTSAFRRPGEQLKLL